MTKNNGLVWAICVLFTLVSCGGDAGDLEELPSLEKARGLLVGRWKKDNAYVELYSEAGLLTSVSNSSSNEILEYHFTEQDLTAVAAENRFLFTSYTLDQQERRLLLHTTTYLDPTTYAKEEKEIITLTREKLTLRTVQLKMQGKARVEEVLYLTRM